MTIPPVLAPWGGAARTLLRLGQENPSLLRRAMRANPRNFHVLAWYLLDRAPGSIVSKGAAATAAYLHGTCPRTLLAELAGSDVAPFLWKVMKRIDEPAGAFAPDLYQSLGRWARCDRLRAVLDAMNPVTEAAIRLVEQLEAGDLPLATHAFRCLDGRQDVDDLLTVLAVLVRHGAVRDDTPTRATLLAFRSRRQLDRWIWRQVDDLRAPRLLSIPATVPLFQLTSVRDLRRAAQTFENCLASPLYALALADGDLFFLWKGGEEPVVGHAYRFATDIFGLGDCRRRANETAAPQDIEAIREALRRCGVPLVRGPIGDALPRFDPTRAPAGELLS